MRYLLDTNVLCELAKGTPSPAVVDWFSAHDGDELYISSITVGEIAYGIEKKEKGKARNELQKWFNSVLLEWFGDSILTLDTEVMLMWGKLKAESRTLPVLDSQIAATALASDAALVTRNIKDFEGIEGLRVINPFI